MKYLTVAETAEKWNISERRVRVLCSEGRIEGVVSIGKAYAIPLDAAKPLDGRTKHPAEIKELYLMWADSCIGTIDSGYSVHFSKPEYNTAVALYTKGKSFWTRTEFEAFLSARIISRDRRDIEKILFRLGFSQYDVIKVALATRAINSKDCFWIAFDLNERFEAVMTDVFKSIFLKNKDLEGDSVNSPEGFNIKRYGVYNGKYGIYKNRINPLTTDAESEQAVYELAKLLGVACCPAYLVGKDTVFSEFLYDFSKEYIVHFRRLADGIKRGSNEYQNLISLRPQYQKDIIKMICLDFITRQDDRHLSNIAVKVSGDGESFYPLYDNGRSLFYDETEETVRKAVKDIKTYATAFGPEGTYFDFVLEIADAGVDFSKLLNLNIRKKDVEKILKSAKITGYRFDGCIEWIMGAIAILKQNCLSI